MKITFKDIPQLKPDDTEMIFVKVEAGGGCDEFWMSETPVTEAQWARVMGEAASSSQRPKLNVSFDEASEFCSKMGNGYRLPTDSEFCWALGKEPKDMEKYAVFGQDGDCPLVKTKFPNEWGLYDMRGLCWEWIESGQEYKYLRGGSWFNHPLDAGAVCRYGSHAARRSNNLGFRVVLCASPSND